LLKRDVIHTKNVKTLKPKTQKVNWSYQYRSILATRMTCYLGCP